MRSWKNKAKRVELLAPAGGMEAFRGALNAGADAVYLAGQQFGARAYAGNFTEEELEEVLEKAHLFSVRIYLTVNTLTREKELSELTSFVQRLAEKGLDGVIVQDLGVAAAIRRSCPGVELHASTQMSVTGREAVRFLKRQGFVRVVPARELSLEEIRLLKQEEIEVESFIHGAMCYSYSGRCLMSSFLGGRSGNRGRCAGTCRLPYEILEEQGLPAGRDGVCYPISMKDMCVLSILPELIDCGIDSFKIEGRMKKPEYVAGTVAIYRKYIDRFYEWDSKGRPGSWAVDETDRKMLENLYIRSDLCTGYYHEQNGRNMVTIHEPGYRGADPSLLEQIRKKYLEEDRKQSITGTACVFSGEPVRMSVSLGDTVYEADGAVAEAARNRALSEEDIRGKLGKAGDTPFRFEELTVYTDGKSFLPVSALGELRRKALDGLKKMLLPDVSAGVAPLKEPVAAPEEIRLPSSFLMVRDAEQAEAVLRFLEETGRDGRASFSDKGVPVALVLDGMLLDFGAEGERQRERIFRESEGLKLPVYAALPYVFREKDRTWLIRFLDENRENIYGFVTRNLEEVEFLCEKEYDKTVLADSTLYIWNHESERILRSFCQGMVLPQELDRRELEETFGKSSSDKILMVYGRVPLMVTANCVRKTEGKCRRTEGKNRKTQSGSGFWYLQDRTGAEFPVEAQCSHCQNIIYNSVPTSLHRFAEDPLLKKCGAVMMSFTTENGKAVQEVLMHFAKSGILRAMMPEAACENRTEEGKLFSDSGYTNGHYRKGAI
ncbi:peptidase U32 family protein [Bacillota bacterium LCP21S3_D9]